MYNYNMMKKLRQKMNEPVGEKWIEGFLHGVVMTFIGIGVFYVEIAYVLPWMFD